MQISASVAVAITPGPNVGGFDLRTGPALHLNVIKVIAGVDESGQGWELVDGKWRPLPVLPEAIPF